MAKDRDQERREIVRRLEDEEARLHADKARVISQYDRKLEAAKARRLRAEGPYPPGDPCPICWIEHGTDSQMKPQSSGYGVDVFQCGVCGNSDERRS